MLSGHAAFRSLHPFWACIARESVLARKGWWPMELERQELSLSHSQTSKSRHTYLSRIKPSQSFRTKIPLAVLVLRINVAGSFN
jgi:hypothetical protein